MAQFIGIAGEFQKERALKRRMDGLACLFVLMSFAFFVAGYAAAKMSIWISLAAIGPLSPHIAFIHVGWKSNCAWHGTKKPGPTARRKCCPI